MIHTISGHNFHGYYSFKIRAPKDGGKLSERQLDRVYAERCGMHDCTCGGGYGNGPASDSAQIDQYGYLHPADCKCPDC